MAVTQDARDKQDALKALKPAFNTKVFDIVPDVNTSIGIVGKRGIGFVIGVPEAKMGEFDVIVASIKEVFLDNDFNGYPIGIRKSEDVIAFDLY